MDKMRDYIKSLGRVAIALSGGLDSSTLLRLCADVLGAKNCLAVTAHTPYMMSKEREAAHELCDSLGVEYLEISMGIPQSILNNPPERCYLCKTEIFSRLVSLARLKGFENIADGTNSDDVCDYRPGMRALKELGVISPLLDCGVGKSQIRKIARSYKMAVSEKPAYACLMTRLEHGELADESVLANIDKAENFLRGLGFDSVRVRVHSQCARIEIDKSKIGDFCVRENMDKVSEKLKSFGFKFVSLDLCGYSRGAMNEIK